MANQAMYINAQLQNLFLCTAQYFLSDPSPFAETTRFLVEQGTLFALSMLQSVLVTCLPNRITISTGHFFDTRVHNLTVGRDGNYLKPFTANYAVINTGQTMDILITADQPRNLYYMAANCYGTTPSPLGLYSTLTTAIVEYHGCNSSETSSLLTSTSSMYNFTILPRSLASKDHPIDVPVEIGTWLVFTLSTNHQPCSTCQGPNGTRFAASMNNSTFVNPPIDIFEAYYADIKNIYTTDFPSFSPFLFNFTSND
ncbi:Laccase-21 [Nymphaea thermarum]|nr:Laccase-21 [Nymphaea thermarum]